MKYGIAGPFYTIGSDRGNLLEWFRRVDAGPFATIAAGERMLWPKVEHLTFLAAAAAVTDRVKIMSHVTLAPMHAAVLLAKQIASIDVISGGRFVLGVGTGGRAEDYRAGGSPFTNRFQRMDDTIAAMRRIWAGELPWEGAAEQAGPPPAQSSGPPILSSASGPKAMARAARWADGWCASIMSADLETMKRERQSHLTAWRDAGREKPPYTTNGIWFALGAQEQARMPGLITRYLRATGGSPSAPSARFTTLTSDGRDGLRRAIDSCEQAGFDELLLMPVTNDLAELDRLEAVLDSR
jgi:alkanesulfonate monooxygenase SsuD/methylene tetrahydromethanopterin reductase-like flavin-dependent oxidoreductase (luciferase family)